MARIQMSVVEFIKYLQNAGQLGKFNREVIAKHLADIWASNEMYQALRDKSEEMARRAMRDVIDSSFNVKETGWGNNKQYHLSGWASELVKEYIKDETRDAIVKETTSAVMQEIKPELEKAVNQIIGKLFVQQLAKEQWTDGN